MFLTSHFFLTEASSTGTLVFTVENSVEAGSFKKSRALKKRAKKIELPLMRNTSHSTNSGLRHIALACGGANGTFELSLGSRNNSVLFELSMPALLMEMPLQKSDVVGPLREEDEEFIHGLRIFAMDDSKVCLGMLQHSNF